MLQQLKRKCRPTTFLLVIGFAVSLTAVLIGISSVNSILIALSEMESETPVYLTMQNTGLSLAFAIYLFSIVNCFAVTNYWIITQRRTMAVYKAFGWTDMQLAGKIIADMAGLLSISLCISMLLLDILRHWNPAVFSIRLTPFFIIGTLVLLLVTLAAAAVIPVISIMKIKPAEVIS